MVRERVWDGRTVNTRVSNTTNVLERIPNDYERHCEREKLRSELLVWNAFSNRSSRPGFFA